MQFRDTLGHGEEKIEALLTSLESDRQVATSTHGPTMNALTTL